MLAMTVSMTILSYLAWAWAIICQVRITLCVSLGKYADFLGEERAAAAYLLAQQRLLLALRQRVMKPAVIS